MCWEIGSSSISKIPTKCWDFGVWEIACWEITNGPLIFVEYKLALGLKTFWYADF